MEDAILELKDTALEAVTGGFGSTGIKLNLKISNSFNIVSNEGNGKVTHVGNGNGAQVIYMKDNNMP